MANKTKMTLDELEMIKRVVRAEVAELAEDFDNVQLTNLKTVSKCVDRNTHNVMKLQAQVTALKELLIASEVVSRQRLYEREKAELVRIEKMTIPTEEAVAGGN